MPAGEGGIVVENTRADKVVGLSVAELAKLPRAEVEAGKEHRKYSGVPLAELLHCRRRGMGRKVLAAVDVLCARRERRRLSSLVLDSRNRSASSVTRW